MATAIGSGSATSGVVALPEIPAQEIEQQALRGSVDAADRESYATGLMFGPVRIYWTTIAAENGSPIGAYNLGITLFDDGYLNTVAQPFGDFRQDRAFFWFRRAAALGDRKASTEIDRLFGNGRNRIPEPDTIIEGLRVTDATMIRFRQSAMRGSPSAAYRLYEHYKALGDLPHERLYWATIAAQNGNSKAYRIVGELILRGTLQDQTRAAFWLKKAADAGDASAAELLKKYFPAK